QCWLRSLLASPSTGVGNVRNENVGGIWSAPVRGHLVHAGPLSCGAAGTGRFCWRLVVGARQTHLTGSRSPARSTWWTSPPSPPSQRTARKRGGRSGGRTWHRDRRWHDRRWRRSRRGRFSRRPRVRKTLSLLRPRDAHLQGLRRQRIQLSI